MRSRILYSAEQSSSAKRSPVQSILIAAEGGCQVSPLMLKFLRRKPLDTPGGTCLRDAIVAFAATKVLRNALGLLLPRRGCRCGLVFARKDEHHGRDHHLFVRLPAVAHFGLGIGIVKIVRGVIPARDRPQ